MPIRVKTDLEFGQLIYIKSDPEQRELVLVGLKIVPSNQVVFILSDMGGEVEFYDFECSTERDDLKYIENKKDSEE